MASAGGVEQSADTGHRGRVPGPWRSASVVLQWFPFAVKWVHQGLDCNAGRRPGRRKDTQMQALRAGKIAAVTGGARGIGLAVVRALAAEGVGVA